MYGLAFPTGNDIVQAQEIVSLVTKQFRWKINSYSVYIATTPHYNQHLNMVEDAYWVIISSHITAHEKVAEETICEIEELISKQKEWYLAVQKT